MTQREIDTEVANATGESVATIRTIGFSILQASLPDEEKADIAIADTVDNSAA